MRRRRTKKPITGQPAAIITADIELRLHPPVCRLDENYFQTLKDKIKWLSDLQNELDCPILDGGDLFDKRYKQQPSHLLLEWAIRNFPRNFYSVPGNHDLPGKSIENYKNSAMAVLARSGIVEENYILRLPNDGTALVDRIPWGCPVVPGDNKRKYDKRIALVHAMVYDGNPPFPDCVGYEKNEVLEILDGYDLIVCGHNHQSFLGKRGKTILVNPGSLMRNDADQIDYLPRVFLWYPEDNEVVPVPVPVVPGMVSREHLDVIQQEETRLSAFVESLGNQQFSGIKFEENLEQLCSGLSPKITEKVWGYYEQKNK